jgi:hypothetical protein
MALKYVYGKHDGDKNVIDEYRSILKKNTIDELVDKFNKQARCGIVGVHRQALFLYALRMEFLERLEQSPITIENERILDLSGEIELIDDEIRPKKQNEK